MKFKIQNREIISILKMVYIPLYCFYIPFYYMTLYDIL